MNLEIFNKLNNATLTEKDFIILPYLEQNSYEESANLRFSKLDTHLETSHVDWHDRIAANSELSILLDDYLRKNKCLLAEKNTINLIELGSSLGAITTLLSLKVLANHSLLQKTQIWLSDIYAPGLEKTKRLEFNLSLILEKSGVDRKHFQLIAKKISEAQIACANITQLPKNLPQFDIILSGFTHHHLNTENKELACKEMEKIARKGAFLGVGDLFFEYKEFIQWLKKHMNEKNSNGERIPYAIESFIPLNDHIAFFAESNLQLKHQKQKFYTFYLIKK